MRDTVVESYENSEGTKMTYVDYLLEASGTEMYHYVPINEAGDTIQVVALTQTGEFAPQSFTEAIESIKVLKN